MREREFRFLRLHTSFSQASDLVQSFATTTPPRSYTVHYLHGTGDPFRCKHGRWEIKRKISVFAFYHTGVWLKFVESEERRYALWTPDECRRFYRRLATRQMPVVHEYRYEIQLPPAGRRAKLYAFHKPSNHTTGLVFEVEWPRPDPDVLRPYVSILHALDREGTPPPPPSPFPLLPYRRKPVVHLDRPPPLLHCMFVAVKHDGVFGWIASYSDGLFEKWEDNVQKWRPGVTLGPALLLAAERLPDGRVVLLDVYQAEGARVYRRDVRHVLVEALPALRIPQELRCVYAVQRYHTSLSSVAVDVGAAVADAGGEEGVEGLIYHTFRDRVYKLKRMKTVDLMHEGGFFRSSCGERFKAPDGLQDGQVYECDLQLKPLRTRPDRFCGNTPEQLARLGQIPSML